jgi:4-hydroxy-3-methylbut-2-enyl diphosphate reductase
MSKIYITGNVGFCFGVKRAMEKLNEIRKKTDEKIYTFGEIIHNNDINNKLLNKNIVISENIDEIEENSIVFIRTHGVPKIIIDKLKEKNIRIFDVTCPKVKKIQHIANESDNIILAGDINHPEVKGIIGNSKKNYYVFC